MLVLFAMFNPTIEKYHFEGRTLIFPSTGGYFSVFGIISSSITSA